MIFTKGDRILIKVLRVEVPESCWRNFLTRTGLVQHWTDFCGRLTLQGLQTGSPAAAENVRTLDMQISVQMATTLSTTVTDMVLRTNC